MEQACKWAPSTDVWICRVDAPAPEDQPVAVLCLEFSGVYPRRADLDRVQDIHFR